MEELQLSPEKLKLQSEAPKSSLWMKHAPEPASKNQGRSTQGQKSSKNLQALKDGSKYSKDKTISSLQNAKSSNEEQKPSQEDQEPSQVEQKSQEAARASALANHVKGAVLNILSAFSAAVDVTALQLVSVNTRSS